MSDEGVRETNADACLRKANCVEKGYWDDPFVSVFLKGNEKKSNSPLINRGYWARVTYIMMCLRSFIDQHREENPQIINIGAGWDTTFFRLKQHNILPNKCHWVEMDFGDTNHMKVNTIMKSSEMTKLLSDDPNNLLVTETEIRAPQYSLVSVDLRNSDSLRSILSETLVLDATCPTFVLAECVLVYMQSAHSDKLLRAFTETFTTNLTLLAYEAVNPNDPFGRMMVQNLQQRGCPLLGINRYPTLASQRDRYLNLGLQTVAVRDMLEVYNNLPSDERKAIEKLEILDEVEEWNLLLSHYCFVLASASH